MNNLSGSEPPNLPESVLEMVPAYLEESAEFREPSRCELRARKTFPIPGKGNELPDDEAQGPFLKPLSIDWTFPPESQLELARDAWARLGPAEIDLTQKVSTSDEGHAFPPLDLSRPFKDQVTNRFLQCCAKLGSMPLFSSVYLIHDALVAKFGPRVRQSEAATLKYLRDVVQISAVPRILDFFREKETGYWCIIMERIKGMPLELKLDEYTDLERVKVTRQLRDILDRMRARNSPNIASLTINAKGGMVRGRITDRFFLNGRDGPFEDEQMFASALHQSLLARTDGCNTECVGLLLRHLLGTTKDEPRFVLTNASLGAHNILVNGTEVVGVLSWSQAGFYPVYWEYVKASFWDEDFFGGENVIANALDPYFGELSVLLHARDIVW